MLLVTHTIDKGLIDFVGRPEQNIVQERLLSGYEDEHQVIAIIGRVTSLTDLLLLFIAAVSGSLRQPIRNAFSEG